ncbi:MAG: hypothetical protein AAF628_26900 [Planctomycetota bacterium]
MSKIVLELQRDALDSAVSISDLLRKSLLVARKLGLTDFEAWVKKEMDGYGSEQPPDYRIARGEVRAWNPYHGWQPVIFQDPDEADRLCRRAFGDSVAQLEDLIGRGGDDKSGTFHIPLPQGMQRQLDRAVDFPVPTNYSLFTERTALVRALDAVRNVVLNWAIELEQQEILGDGLSFTPQEKSHAAAPSLNVNNFFGTVHGSQFQQGNATATQTISNDQWIDSVRDVVNELRRDLQRLDLDDLRSRELQAEVATAEVQLDSPSPKRSIVSECLGSARRILEGAGGTLAAQLATKIAPLLF